MPSNKKPRTRTYARIRAVGRKRGTKETDSSFLLKLALYVVLGSIWLKFKDPIVAGPLFITGIPIGILIGFIIISQFEKTLINRKIMYSLVAIITIISYFLPSGIVI